MITASRYTLKTDPYSSHSVILRWVGQGHGRRLLDVGAADGLLSERLTDAGWRVTGLEADPESVRTAAARCERTIIADLDQKVPDPGGPFSAIVYGDVLEHLREPRAVLDELNGSLAPDGQVVVSVPNVAHLWIRLSLLAGRFEYTDRGILDRTHLRFFTRRSLRALLAEAGLAIVRETVTPVPLFQVVPSHLHGRLLAAINGTSAVIARALPRLLGYQFIALARPLQLGRSVGH